MNGKSILLAAMLAIAAQLPAAGARSERLQELTFGFAAGKGFVTGSDAEIAALQWRLEFRSRWMYAASRLSWVAQECNSRPNPKELSLLAGASLPLGNGRTRFNIGLGLGLVSAHGRQVASLPCEARLKHGAIALTAFSNFNGATSFHGLCVSLDFPVWSVRR